jgi:predicted nucleic acid-binding protein
MVLVDTSAWYAATIPSDPDHQAAVRWLDGNRESLVTTDYVVDETLTLLRVRGHAARAQELGAELFQESRAALHYLTREEIEAAWQVFRVYADKEWSFTDCTSKVMMERLGITTAFAFDHHVRQFGSMTVVP